MMAFFLVMWLVGQSKAVKAGVGGYFRDPGAFEHERSTGILPGATAGIAREGPPPAAAPPKDQQDELDQASIEKSAQRIREMLSKLPDFDKLKGQIEYRKPRRTACVSSSSIRTTARSSTAPARSSSPRPRKSSA